MEHKRSRRSNTQKRTFPWPLKSFLALVVFEAAAYWSLTLGLFFSPQMLKQFNQITKHFCSHAVSCLIYLLTSRVGDAVEAYGNLKFKRCLFWWKLCENKIRLSSPDRMKRRALPSRFHDIIWSQSQCEGRSLVSVSILTRALTRSPGQMEPSAHFDLHHRTNIMQKSLIPHV